MAVSRKTYTREVIRLFTREELAELLKRAHEHCKATVGLTYHSIGKARKRNVVMRPATAYRECIKDFINKAVQDKLKGVVK